MSQIADFCANIHIQYQFPYQFIVANSAWYHFVVNGQNANGRANCSYHPSVFPNRGFLVSLSVTHNWQSCQLAIMSTTTSRSHPKMNYLSIPHIISSPRVKAVLDMTHFTMMGQTGVEQGTRHHVDMYYAWRAHQQVKVEPVRYSSTSESRTSTVPKVCSWSMYFNQCLKICTMRYRKEKNFREINVGVLLQKKPISGEENSRQGPDHGWKFLALFILKCSTTLHCASRSNKQARKTRICTLTNRPSLPEYPMDALNHHYIHRIPLILKNSSLPSSFYCAPLFQIRGMRGYPLLRNGNSPPDFGGKTSSVVWSLFRGE